MESGKVKVEKSQIQQILSLGINNFISATIQNIIFLMNALYITLNWIFWCNIMTEENFKEPAGGNRDI